MLDFGHHGRDLEAFSDLVAYSGGECQGTDRLYWIIVVQARDYKHKCAKIKQQEEEEVESQVGRGVRRRQFVIPSDDQYAALSQLFAAAAARPMSWPKGQAHV